MNRRTEILLHSAAALTVLAVWLGTRRAEPEFVSNSEARPVTAASKNPAKFGTDFRMRATAGFAARMAEIPKMENQHDRYCAWTRLADEAFRTSADAARLVLAAFAEAEPDLEEKERRRLESLLVLCGSGTHHSLPELQRLNALCHEEALTDLKQAGYHSQLGVSRAAALQMFALHDLEKALKFIEDTPESVDDALLSGFALENDRRAFNRWLDGILGLSARHPKPLESWSLQSAESMSPETQMKVAAKLGAAAEENDTSRRLFHRFHAKANPETRRWLEENSPLTETQTAALLTAAVKAGETKRAKDELRWTFRQISDPAALLRAMPTTPEMAEITGELYREWATYDAVGLSAALAEGGLPEPDRAIETLVRSQRDDPRAQLLWARKISDPATRQRVLEPLLKRHAAALPDLVQKITEQQAPSVSASPAP